MLLGSTQQKDEIFERGQEVPDYYNLFEVIAENLHCKPSGHYLSGNVLLCNLYIIFHCTAFRRYCFYQGSGMICFYSLFHQVFLIGVENIVNESEL